MIRLKFSKFEGMLKNILTILFLFFAIIGYTQEEGYVYGDNASTTKSSSGDGFSWERATIGGGFYAAFGSNSYFLIAPTFGYHLTDNFLVGVGLNYAYERVSFRVTNFPYKSHTYGGSVFSQFKFGDLPFLAHAELEYANINVDFDASLDNDLTLNLINSYVGGGLRQQMGSYSYFYALILFNLNETKESGIVQQNPVIRVGVALGL